MPLLVTADNHVHGATAKVFPMVKNGLGRPSNEQSAKIWKSEDFVKA
jgi:hypothetical protein